MARLKNRDLIGKFLQGTAKNTDQNHGGSLWMAESGLRLMHHHTCIAVWCDGKLIMNETKYSQTTTKLQTWLKWDALSLGITVTAVKDVPIGNMYIEQRLEDN